MQLLTIITLIFAGILVLALAASLITILIYLIKISRSLGEVREVLDEVAKETEPLTPVIEEFDRLIDQASNEVAQAAGLITEADESMEQAVEDKAAASYRS
jgi:ABC-type transporter Mla subunit MlaD